MNSKQNEILDTYNSCVMKTNKLRVSYEYEKINKAFDFYKIEKDEWYDFGSEVLDIEDKYILSVSFNGGKIFFLMTKKNATSCRKLIEMLTRFKDSDMLSVLKIKAEDLLPSTLFNLFLNSLAVSEGSHVYNNLTGKLYVFNKAWTKQRQGKYSQIDCLEIKVDGDFNLKLEARRFVPYNKLQSNSHKNFIKPIYQFSYINNTFKRVFDNKQNDLFVKGAYGNRPHIKYLDLANLDKFNSSKLGQWNKIKALLEFKYSSYFSIEYTEYKDISTIKSNKKALAAYMPEIDKFVSANSFHIVDRVENSFSVKIAKLIYEYLSANSGGVLSSENLSNKSINIVIVHDKDYYQEKNVNDPHNCIPGNYIVQHVTLENFGDNLDKFNLLMQVIFKEIYMKYEVNKKRIMSLYNDLIKDICITSSFIIFKKSKEEADSYMYRLKFDKSGQMFFDNLGKGMYISEYMKYSQLVGKRSKEYLLVDNGNSINLIQETDEKPLPNIDMIYEGLSNNLGKNSVDSKILIDCLNDTLKCWPEYEKQIIQVKNQISINARYTYKEFLDMFPGDRPSASKLFKRVADTYYKKTGQILKFYYRGSKQKLTYFPYCFDINHTVRSNWNGEDEIIYNVGDLSEGLQTSMSNGPVIRKVTCEKGNLFFDTLIELLNVGFVKYHTYTAVPFPFKYLREYIRMQNCSSLN